MANVKKVTKNTKLAVLGVGLLLAILPGFGFYTEIVTSDDPTGFGSLDMFLNFALLIWAPAAVICIALCVASFMFRNRDAKVARVINITLLFLPVAAALAGIIFIA